MTSLEVRSSLACDGKVIASVNAAIGLCIGQTDITENIGRCISSNLMNGYFPNTNWETVAYQDGMTFFLNNYPIDQCLVTFKYGGNINFQVWRSK